MTNIGGSGSGSSYWPQRPSAPPDPPPPPPPSYARVVSVLKSGGINPDRFFDRNPKELDKYLPWAEAFGVNWNNDKEVLKFFSDMLNAYTPAERANFVNLHVDKKGCTPLHNAVLMRDPKVVQQFLSWGADPSITVKPSDQRAVRHLAGRAIGADPHYHEGYVGRNALTLMAAIGPGFSPADDDFEKSNKLTAVHHVIHMLAACTVASTTPGHAEVPLTVTRDDRGDTPIMAAVLANHDRAVSDLAKSDPAAARSPDHWGFRPLDQAVARSPDSVASLVGATLPMGSPYDQNAVDELSNALRCFARCSETHSPVNNDRIMLCFFSQSPPLLPLQRLLSRNCRNRSVGHRTRLPTGRSEGEVGWPLRVPNAVTLLPKHSSRAAITNICPIRGPKFGPGQWIRKTNF